MSDLPMCPCCLDALDAVPEAEARGGLLRGVCVAFALAVPLWAVVLWWVLA